MTISMALPHTASAFPICRLGIMASGMGKHFIFHGVESICEVPLEDLSNWDRSQEGGNIIRESGLQRVVLGNYRDILGLQWSISGVILEYYYCEIFHKEYVEIATKFHGHSWGTAR